MDTPHEFYLKKLLGECGGGEVESAIIRNRAYRIRKLLMTGLRRARSKPSSVFPELLNRFKRKTDAQSAERPKTKIIY